MQELVGGAKIRTLSRVDRSQQRVAHDLQMIASPYVIKKMKDATKSRKLDPRAGGPLARPVAEAEKDAATR
jgi:hypothetical protein